MGETDTIDLRVWGKASLPALVYLPGLHGDGTLIGGFRRALTGRVRFVEITYPRSLTWSVADYARAVGLALAERGIASGWLLGESFGSQVVWSLAAGDAFRATGIILAGGFGRHPMPWGARLAAWLIQACPLWLWVGVLAGYARIARLRFRSEPEVRAGLAEFIARRTNLDRLCWVHRLHLVASNDPTPLARRTPVPVYGLTGVLDPIVPWPFVRHWLRRHCPALRDYQVLPGDHNVLSTASARSAEQVVRWMIEPGPKTPGG